MSASLHRDNLIGPKRMTNDTLALSPRLQARARDIYETRRHGLYVTADRTFFVLLAGQWVALFVLGLPSFHWRTVPGPCSAGPGLWTALLLGAVVCGAPVALICRRPGQLVTRRVIGASQVLFNILLMYVTSGSLDSALYLFISLSLLVFYRDWRLLVLVGATVLMAQYSYGRVGCAVQVVAGDA